MKYKAIEIYRVKNTSDWWFRLHTPIIENVLFVNPTKRPQFKYRLARGA